MHIITLFIKTTLKLHIYIIIYIGTIYQFVKVLKGFLINIMSRKLPADRLLIFCLEHSGMEWIQTIQSIRDTAHCALHLHVTQAVVIVPGRRLGPMVRATETSSDGLQVPVGSFNVLPDVRHTVNSVLCYTNLNWKKMPIWERKKNI